MFYKLVETLHFEIPPDAKILHMFCCYPAVANMRCHEFSEILKANDMEARYRYLDEVGIIRLEFDEEIDAYKFILLLNEKYKIELI